MKRIAIKIGLAVLAALAFIACDNDYYDDGHYINDPNYYDNTAPSPVEGLYAVSGDRQVTLYWTHNPEEDLAGYNVYWSDRYYGEYNLLGSTESNSFVDIDALNGEVYYYAVAAYDYNGNEGELSYNEVKAAPRPEGRNAAIFDYIQFPATGGFSFYSFSVVAYDDSTSDFYFENANGVHYLNVWSDTDIQDMGATTTFDDVYLAPEEGWGAKSVEAIVGHTYVIWTWDNRFAKVRIKNITADRVVFDWAFQTVEGSPILKPGKTSRNFDEVKERSATR
jgi:hypothetical protein